MKLIACFIILISFLLSCNSPQSPVEIQKSHEKEFSTGSGKNIVVTVDQYQDMYIGTKKIDDKQLFDSLLTVEIKNMRLIADTATVVINADTASMYGQIFDVMQVAKRAGARVVANVKR